MNIAKEIETMRGEILILREIETKKRFKNKKSQEGYKL